MKQQTKDATPSPKEKIHVPRWLQNELYEKTEPQVEKLISAYQKAGLGWSRFSLNTMALDMAAMGYFHADPNPPEEKPSTSIPVKEGQDEGLDITPGEWYISESIQHDENMCPVPYYEIANKNSSFWIAQINASDIAFGKTQAENNAKAICTAVNGSYGKNLDPAHYEEVYLALKAIVKVMNEFHGQMPVAFRSERATAEQAIKHAKL